MVGSTHVSLRQDSNLSFQSRIVDTLPQAYPSPNLLHFIEGHHHLQAAQDENFLIILNFWLFTHSVSTSKSFSSSFKKYIPHLTTSRVCSVLPTILSAYSSALYILFST